MQLKFTLILSPRQPIFLGPVHHSLDNEIEVGECYDAIPTFVENKGRVILCKFIRVYCNKVKFV